jgi:hypothetical protein
MKRIKSALFLLTLTICCSIFMSADFINSGEAPTGFTGAEGSTCINCHRGNTLNASGGSVVIEGLPQSYNPGESYNFTVKINHADADRKRWGFAVKAVSTIDPNVAGTFSATNTNARISEGEVGHSRAPFTDETNTYTFDQLKWTAPSNPTPNQQSITFYVVGNAANGSGSSGDFIYTATKTILLTNTSISEKGLLEKNIKISAVGKSILAQLNLDKSSSIEPIIYTLGGQKALHLPAKKYNSGKHNINIDGSNLPGGTYLLIIQNNGKPVSKKFVL